MSLSYTTYVTTRKTQPGKPWIVLSETRERVTRELRAPRHWSCFTSKGNGALRRKAERLIAKIEGIMEDGSIPWHKRSAKAKAALVSFLASWIRMWDSKTYGDEGISDTAVREVVGSFHDEVLKAISGSDYVDWDEWEKNYAAAQRRVYGKRGY